MKYYSLRDIGAKIEKNEKGYYDITFAKKVQNGDKSFYVFKYSLSDLPILSALITKIVQDNVKVSDKEEEEKEGGEKERQKEYSKTEKHLRDMFTF
ncbi:MAG: hypothetical protein NC925_01745 [Candidatus Omnitrophica bacterium]|nr:hypothetical protein [Candidatus Omnitrophota bacterium]